MNSSITAEGAFLSRPRFLHSFDGFVIGSGQDEWAYLHRGDMHTRRHELLVLFPEILLPASVPLPEPENAPTASGEVC